MLCVVQAEREEEWRGKSRGGGKNMDKQRKQLAELEAQLVLASPHLLFQVSDEVNGEMLLPADSW